MSGQLPYNHGDEEQLSRRLIQAPFGSSQDWTFRLNGRWEARMEGGPPSGVGTAEQWIKEGKEATHWTRLSCHRFRANEVRLLLGVIAYNLGNLLRRLALPVAIQSWSLTSLQQRLFKTGGRLIRHARYFILQLAESHLTQSLFGQILGRIDGLAWHLT